MSGDDGGGWCHDDDGMMVVGAMWTMVCGDDGSRGDEHRCVW